MSVSVSEIDLELTTSLVFASASPAVAPSQVTSQGACIPIFTVTQA